MNNESDSIDPFAASPPWSPGNVLDASLDDVREGIDYAERHGLISPNEKRELRTRIRDARKEIKEVVRDFRKLTGKRRANPP